MTTQRQIPSYVAALEHAVRADIAACEARGERYDPTITDAQQTESDQPAPVPSLSGIQQARQQRIYRNGADVVRSRRLTGPIEARQTNALTDTASALLQAEINTRDLARLEQVAANFTVRERALKTAA